MDIADLRSGLRLRRLLVLSCLALASSAAAQTADCVKPSYRFCDGCAMPVPVRVKPGATCVFNLYNTGGTLLGFNVVTRPNQGQWGQAGPNRFAYQTRANASGTDYFEVEIRYENRGRPTSTRMQATVTFSR
jgi:hypothetical protein